MKTVLNTTSTTYITASETTPLLSDSTIIPTGSTPVITNDPTSSIAAVRINSTTLSNALRSGISISDQFYNTSMPTNSSTASTGYSSSSYIAPFASLITSSMNSSKVSEITSSVVDIPSISTSVAHTVSTIILTSTTSSTVIPSTESDSSYPATYVVETKTITSSSDPSYTISTGTKYNYLIYTQSFEFTDSQTTFVTGLPETTRLKNTASSTISVPTAIITKPVSYYRSWLDGSLDQSSNGTVRKTHRNVIIGSVVGSILGFLLCVTLCGFLFVFMRKRKGKKISQEKNNDIFYDDAGNHDEKMVDPFDSEFQFNARLPGQIPERSSNNDSFIVRDSITNPSGPESSVNMSFSTHGFSYTNSDTYSYTRSISDWSHYTRESFEDRRRDDEEQDSNGFFREII